VPSAIYLHIPFCRIKCPYCDFVSFAGREELIPRYVRALARELEARLQRSTPTPFAPISLYFGGGTPSLLTADQVAFLLAEVRRLAAPRAAMEVTLEANPGTVDRASLGALREAGVNRLTLGCQTFQPEFLPGLGRLHDVQDNLRAIADARAAGFAERNLDLMFGLPDQTLEQWSDDLDIALGSEPSHLSLYDLTVEPGTDFARREERGLLDRPDEELRAAMYELACQRCEEAGLLAYEVSNFARPGSECRHNQVYWRGHPYIGVGVAAHGFAPATGHPDFGRRWWNRSDPLGYVHAVEAGELPEAGSERLTRRQAMDEALLLGLRTREGIRRDVFRRRFGVDLDVALGAPLQAALAAGLVRSDEEAIVATQAGRITLDSLIRALSRQLDSPRRSSTLP